MAGIKAERQEKAVLSAINEAVARNKKNPITVIAGKTKLYGVISAEKYYGRQTTGSEPYTDIVITSMIGGKKNTVQSIVEGRTGCICCGWWVAWA